MIRTDHRDILIISGSYPDMRCGVAPYVKNLAEKLISMNADVCVLTSLDPAVKKEKYVYPLIKRWNMRSLSKILFFIKDIKPKLINLQVASIKYRAVLSSISFLPLLAKLFFKNIPLVLTLHDFSISNSYLKVFFLPLLLFVDKILVTNKSDEDDLVKRFPFLKQKIRKKHMEPTVGIEEIACSRKEALLEKVRYAEGDSFIATFGFIKPDRHLKTVINVFDRLRRRNNKLKLIIIGDIQRKCHEKYRNYLIGLCRRLGLENKIFWLGFCDDKEVSFCLSKSSLSILLYERGASFRRSTLINCVLRKIPVVTNINKKYDRDEDLSNANAVLTVNSLDVDEIVKKSELILYDENIANRLKERMETVGDTFSWKNTVLEILDTV